MNNNSTRKRKLVAVSLALPCLVTTATCPLSTGMSDSSGAIWALWIAGDNDFFTEAGYASTTSAFLYGNNNWKECNDASHKSDEFGPDWTTALVRSAFWPKETTKQGQSTIIGGWVGNGWATVL